MLYDNHPRQYDIPGNIQVKFDLWGVIELSKRPISTLLLKVCHKKQENQAAIFNKFSVDADQNAFNILVNLTPLIVN